LGLTMQCAQCHDHKLEPIPQRDYYRLRAVFKGALDEYNWLPPRRMAKSSSQDARLPPYVMPMTNAMMLAEQEETRKAENNRLQEQIKMLEAAVEIKAKPIEENIIEQRLAKAPRELHDDLRQMLGTPPEKRNDRQKYLGEKFEHYLKIDPPDRQALLK